MPKFVNLLLLIVGVILTATGLVGLRHHPNSWLVLLAGMATGMAGILSDDRRRRRIEQRERAASQSRVDTLTRRTWAPGDSLRVARSPWLMPGLLAAATLAGLFMYLGVASARPNWPLFVGGAFFFCLSLLALAPTLGGVRHPALELTIDGIVTPLNGKIAWRDISGIFLSTWTRRTGGKSYRIVFRVKDFARAVERIHWSDRLFAALRTGPFARGEVNVSLPTSKEDPNAVYALARLLWKRATGNDYSWRPGMSAQYNEAAQRLAELTARLKETAAVEPSHVNPRRIDQDVVQIHHYTAVMQNEAKRRLAKGQWVFGLVILLALLTVTTSVILDVLVEQ